MAILATLLAFGSRFAGKILTTALGWASTLLFGRVPADRQKLVLAITFGSVIWMVLLAGVVFPAVGTFLLVVVPQQDVIPEWVIRLAMLAGALIVPAVVGALTLILAGPAQRTPRGIAGAVVRGYPLTALLAVLLVFLAGLSIWRKANSLRRGWVDAHVPIVVNAGAYEQVAGDLDRAVTAAGLEVIPISASAAMSKPARWLALVAGPGSQSLVPDRLIQLDGRDLDILIYPMDLLISGKPELVNRARAAMASRLTSSAAHMTVSAEAQAVEDRLTALARPRSDDAAAEPDRKPRYDDAAESEFRAIDEFLASSPVPYEEWEVLYRQRLQVERDLRAGAMAGDSVLGAAPVGDGEAEGSRFPDVGAALATAGRLVRTGAAVVLAAAADDRTGQLIDRAAGPQWRWAARAASVAAVAARAALSDEPGTAAGRTGQVTGEPVAFPEPPPNEAVTPPDRPR